MESQTHIPPITLLHTPHFTTGATTTTVHRHLQLLLTENHRLTALHLSLSDNLAAAVHDLRRLSAAAFKVKAERDARLREVHDRLVEMEVEVKLIEELKAELDETLADVEKLRLENKELEEKLGELRSDVVRVSSEWDRFQVMKLEIETMDKEVKQRREVTEHEKRVHASNIKQSQTMKDYQVLMAGEIMKLQVEAIDAGKRARAAAAAEAASIPSVI